MNRSPAGEETLVFMGSMRVPKVDGSQVVDLQRDDWPDLTKMTAPSCGGRKRRAKNVDLKLPDQGAEAPPALEPATAAHLNMST